MIRLDPSAVYTALIVALTALAMFAQSPYLKELLYACHR